MSTRQSKHAESLAGAFPAQPPSPPAEGKRRNTTSSPTIAARAILAGKPIPGGHRWCEWAANPDNAKALAELFEPKPVVTAEVLSQLYPDDRDDDPAWAEYVAYNNALSPVERAIEDWRLMLDSSDINEKNPLFCFELRQAHRRILEALVAMAERPSRRASKPRRLGSFYESCIRNLRSAVDELENDLRAKNLHSASETALYISAAAHDIRLKAKPAQATPEVTCADR